MEIDETTNEKLERAIIRYKVPFANDQECLGEETLDKIAKYFAKWGAEHIKCPWECPSFQEGYKLGLKEAKEQLLKGAIEGTIGSTVSGSEQYVSAYIGYGEYGKDGDKVNLLILPFENK
jgi:hypothetical protein